MFDYNRIKVCDLYDSSTNALGQAYGITYSEELNGWKEVSFTLPLMVNGEKNFRWNYIRNEYKLRLTIGQSTDWFVIQKPKRSKNGKTITNVVTCPHESTMLKKKNIYLTFDDENGIDSIENLINKALINTGWTIGVCDTFLENDGSKEKIRSIKSDGKQGTYGLITEICNLFNAYPVYHGDTRKVDIHALGNKEALSEMMVGKNLDTLTVEQNSENIVTRLYVEGEYGDDGYVGIDSANPTGLPFLLNFDYYKEIGVFTQEHQAALDQYLADIAQAKAQVSTLMQQMIEKEDQLNALIGQPNYVLYVLNQGQITAIKRGGDAKEEDEQISLDDKLIIIKSASSYRTVNVTSVPFLFEQTDIYAFKFLTPSAGTIGAKETAIEAKQKMIDQLRKEIAKDEDDPDNPRRSEDIANYQTEIAAIYAGSADVTGLYQLMYDAAVLGYQIYQLEQQYETASDGQAEIEQAFHLAMGDLLNDGYWSDTNYVVGQEVNLYNDAVDVLKQLSKPSVTYSISLVTLSELMDMKPDNFVLNGKIRLYDPDIPINDFVYITKIVHYLDDPKKDTVDISNTDITLTGQGYSSVMSRITELADMVDQSAFFIDWNLTLNKQAAGQAVWIYCAKDALRLMEILNETDGHDALSAKIELRSRAAVEKLYDAGRGLFVSGEHRQVSWASQVWFALADVLPAEDAGRALLNVEKEPDAAIMVSPYMMHHYVDALYHVGMGDKAHEVMLSYWGGMVDMGADTFFELYNPNNPDESPYGSPIVNSYCHAWSCTPSYFLRGTAKKI